MVNSSSRAKRRGGLSPDKYLSEGQVERILKHLQKQSANGSRRAAINEFIVLMLLYCGLRAEELLALRIRNLPCRHDKNMIEVEEGKGNVSRSIVIPDWLSGVIKAFVKKYRKGAKPDSILISSERGHRRVVLKQHWIINGKRQTHRRRQRSRRMTYSSLWSKIRKIGIAAGVGKLHPHMFRHTYLSRLYGISNDLRFVQDQAGHADPKTTAIYTQTNTEERNRQVQSLPVPKVGLISGTQCNSGKLHFLRN
ncbi:MAG: site-specific integrase [Phycisphaerae bacterium]|nr:site-specific integrase [Phycisphaerae bacterium]